MFSGSPPRGTAHGTSRQAGAEGRQSRGKEGAWEEGRKVLGGMRFSRKTATTQTCPCALGRGEQMGAAGVHAGVAEPWRLGRPRGQRGLWGPGENRGGPLGPEEVHGGQWSDGPTGSRACESRTTWGAAAGRRERGGLPAGGPPGSRGTAVQEERPGRLQAARTPARRGPPEAPTPPGLLTARSLATPHALPTWLIIAQESKHCLFKKKKKNREKI